MHETDTCYTYLHLVVAIGDAASEVAMAPMIYQLSNAGIDVDAKDCKDRTALELAMVKGLRVLMVALLRVGTDQATTDYRAVIANLRSPGRDGLMDEYERYSPDIWAAATAGDLGSVYVLINSWCRVKVRRQGRTLIESLRRSRRRSDMDGQTEMVSLLVSYEMTIEFVHATLAGDEEAMLDILMDECDCDVDILDISYVDPQLGSLRPRSLRDTAIALNHPGRILQLLSPKSKRFDPSTGIPDTELLPYTESLEAEAAHPVADADYMCWHHSRFQQQGAIVELHPSLTLSGIEPRLSDEEKEEDGDADSDTDGLLLCTYRSFKDDDEDPDLHKVTGKVTGNEGVKEVRVNRIEKSDTAIRISDRSKHQNKDYRFKVNDGFKDNGKVANSSRTYGDDPKDVQRVHQYVRVDDENGKAEKASKRGCEDGRMNTETSRRREDLYVQLNRPNEALEWNQPTKRTQRKNGRKGNKSSLCVVS